MKLKSKFLLVFLLVSNIPLLVITIFTYDRYTSLVNMQTTQVYTNVFNQAVEEANAKVRNIDHITEIFTFYSESTISIVDDIKKYSGGGKPYTSLDIAISNQNIKFICQNLIYTNSYINGIFVFTPSGVNLGYGYGGNIDVKYGYEPFEEEWYRRAIEAKGRTLVSDVSAKPFIIQAQPSITFTRALYDVWSHEFLGVLLVDCSPDVFDLSNVNTLPDIALLSVQNAAGDILYSNIGDIKAPFAPASTKVMRAALGSNQDLELVAAVNYDKLYGEFGVTRIIIVVMASVCSLVLLVISILLSHYLTAPITHLSEKMANHSMHSMVENERFLGRTDEIGVLHNEYNSMIQEFKRYVKSEYENKLITLDAQMKALESQINSHFLYNTLESINSIAEIEEVESISTMSLALGNMFRYSIKTQSELVTVADELQHVRDYAAIQGIRFDDGFTLSYEIPQELLGCRVLKLILQPIVENALYHGIRYCSAGDHIRLSCAVRQRTLLFTIEDNGVGIPPEQLAEIGRRLAEEAHFTELGQRQKQSIGLKNIHSRIELYYGKGYGLRVRSSEGRGTAIEIRLPLLPFEEE